MDLELARWADGQIGRTIVRRGEIRTIMRFESSRSRKPHAVRFILDDNTATVICQPERDRRYA